MYRHRPVDFGSRIAPALCCSTVMAYVIMRAICCDLLSTVFLFLYFYFCFTNRLDVCLTCGWLVIGVYAFLFFPLHFFFLLSHEHAHPRIHASMHAHTSAHARIRTHSHTYAHVQWNGQDFFMHLQRTVAVPTDSSTTSSNIQARLRT